VPASVFHSSFCCSVEARLLQMLYAFAVVAGHAAVYTEDQLSSVFCLLTSVKEDMCLSWFVGLSVCLCVCLSVCLSVCPSLSRLLTQTLVYEFSYNHCKGWPINKQQLVRFWDDTLQIF